MNNILFKYVLQIIKGTTVMVVSIVAIFGIIIAVSTFARAGSLTPPGAPAATGIRSGPTAMSAEGPAGGYTHVAAAAYCYTLSAAAASARDGDTTTVYTDWRFPSAPEAAVFEGTITTAHYIWTSTEFSTGQGAWVCMRLSDGLTSYSGYSTCSTTAYVRCVR